MPDWLDKAKEAAKKAADEAKGLADKAKNADYGSMIEKTKSIAQSAAEEAKKAADSLSNKEEAGNDGIDQTSAETEAEATPKDNPAPTVAVTQDKTSDPDYKACLQKLQQVESLLQEIKKKL